MPSSSSCSHRRKARIASKGFAGAMVLPHQFHQLKDLATPWQGESSLAKTKASFAMDLLTSASCKDSFGGACFRCAMKLGSG